MVCDSSTGSSLIVLCSPRNGLRSPNVWADRIMFVVPAEKWQERPKQTSSCFTCHKSLVWLSASTQSLDLQSHSFKVVSVGSRADGSTPQPQNTLIVLEALGNTARGYLCLEGVCCCVAGLTDESHGEISGESGAGGAGVSDLDLSQWYCVRRWRDELWGFTWKQRSRHLPKHAHKNVLKPAENWNNDLCLWLMCNRDCVSLCRCFSVWSRVTAAFKPSTLTPHSYSHSHCLWFSLYWFRNKQHP